MKILIFCPYYPPHTGGLESHADEFNKYLSLRGMDIVVFTPKFPKNAPEKEIKYDKVEIIRFSAFEIISNYPLPKFWRVEFWKLWKEIWSEDFDLVISRTRFFNTSLLAFFYAKIKNVRWIHIEHGSDFVQLSSKLKTGVAKLYDYTFGCLVFKFSDLNISISRAVQKFVYRFDKRKSPIIYRGLDVGGIDKIQSDLEIKEKFKDKLIISFVGRLYKWKGVENSILAIKSLPKEIKEKVVFLIIGDGEDFNHLKEASKDEKEIVMLGNLPRNKAIGILKISDIYLHSAYPGGGLSTSLLEAMYCKCAVVATPNEGADEIISNGINGIIIPDNSLENIRNGLLELIGFERKMSTYLKKATEDVRSFFSWEKTANQYEEVFTNKHYK